jgi:hypothetical protein
LVAAVTVGAAPVSAQVPPTSAPTDEVGDVESGVSGTDDTDQPPVTLPLVPIPVGCEAPPLPLVVFVGKVRDRDRRSVRFRIESVRAGTPTPFGTTDAIEVRYGLDAQYLHDGDRYLVAASVEPVLGILVSRVTPPIDNFGGDEVIGVSESDVACPRFEDPTRTLHLDGSPVEASLLEPFWAAKLRLLGSVLLPIGVAAVIVFVLASLRLGVSGVYRTIAGSRR